MSKLEDKLTASIKPANQNKPATPKTPAETAKPEDKLENQNKPAAPKAKPVMLKPKSARVAKPEPVKQSAPKTAAKPKNASSDKYVLQTRRVWPD